MHDLSFADAVRPVRVRVLKLDLREYSLGHEALLLSGRNALLLSRPEAFAELPMEQQVFAVKTAALICSSTWKENQKPSRWLRLWSWATRKANYPLAIADFQNYLAAGRVLPPAPDSHACEVLYGKEDDKGRTLGSPMLAQLYNWVAHNRELFHMEHPWDAPYALAGTLYFAALETEGRARIENAAEADERLAFEKIQEEVAAEEAAGITHGPSVSGPGLATPPPNLG